MRMFWSPDNTSALWWAPAMLGLMLFGIGALLFILPELLSYVVASVFVVAGISMISAAWRMRRQVTYRRVDRQWQVRDDNGGPT